MTDKEKIKHYDTIADIRKRIGGCFGSADGIFAGHPSDEKHAKELRKLAKESKVSLSEVQDIVAGHLYRKEYRAEHIEEQLKEATKLFSKNLS